MHIGFMAENRADDAGRCARYALWLESHLERYRSEYGELTREQADASQRLWDETMAMTDEQVRAELGPELVATGERIGSLARLCATQQARIRELESAKETEYPCPLCDGKGRLPEETPPTEERPPDSDDGWNASTAANYKRTYGVDPPRHLYNPGTPAESEEQAAERELHVHNVMLFLTYYATRDTEFEARLRETAKSSLAALSAAKGGKDG
jgi:hypothetical protein